MKLVLDTNVFNSKKFCDWLLTSKDVKYLPAFAYIEYLYHNLKKGNTESMVDTLLEQMNISIVPFGKDDAAEAVRGSIGNWDFKDNTRDYAIGATAIKLNVKLVTNNLKHFEWMENVVTPDDILEKP